MEAKAIKKPLQKNQKSYAQHEPKLVPKGVPKSLQMRSWKHLVSRVAAKWPPEPLPGSILERFGDHF